VQNSHASGVLPSNGDVDPRKADKRVPEEQLECTVEAGTSETNEDSSVDNELTQGPHNATNADLPPSSVHDSSTLVCPLFSRL